MAAPTEYRSNNFHWTKEEEAKILDLDKSGISHAEIGRMLKISKYAVTAKLIRLKDALSLPRNRRNDAANKPKKARPVPKGATTLPKLPSQTRDEE